MQFHVGDRVRFLNATGGGVVSWILDEDQVMVTDESGFDFPTPVSQCVLVATADEHQEVVEVTRSVPRNKAFERMRPTQQVQKLQDVLEVDLHVEYKQGRMSLSAYNDALEVQLQRFRSTLQEHRQHKGKHVVFIHGKGDGILRSRILEELAKKYPSYTVSDASFQRYGMYGATEVIIK